MSKKWEITSISARNQYNQSRILKNLWKSDIDTVIGAMRGTKIQHQNHTQIACPRTFQYKWKMTIFTTESQHQNHNYHYKNICECQYLFFLLILLETHAFFLRVFALVWCYDICFIDSRLWIQSRLWIRLVVTGD